ncbi:hypothetical protein GJ496_003504 [Pomphorhynchus laevis]|nr:hypothetical protein GJ496_003504 [Pomphorhynchus laevis]
MGVAGLTSRVGKNLESMYLRLHILCYINAYENKYLLKCNQLNNYMMHIEHNSRLQGNEHLDNTDQYYGSLNENLREAARRLISLPPQNNKCFTW